MASYSFKMEVKDVFFDNKTSQDFENELEKFQNVLYKASINEQKLEECIASVFDRDAVVEFKYFISCRRNIVRWFYCIINFFLHVIQTSLKSILILGILYLFVTSHNPTQKFIMRNSQNYIYPIMRSVRLLTLPIIRNYETLAEWHEEGCLVRNPFYQEPALDCWPCEDVRTMVDLSGLYNYSKAYLYNEKPFLVRDVMEKNFTLQDLQMIYKKHKIILEQGTAKFVSSHHALQTLNDVLNADNSLVQKNSINILWKINRVAAARVMRKIFHRPYFVPNSSEVALQRFLCISSSEAPQYFLPLTDFANVWMVQGQGYRLIVLDPSEPCAHNCSSVSVLLRPQDVLYYNWQFWRPRSLPARLSKDISITYIGSFY